MRAKALLLCILIGLFITGCQKQEESTPAASQNQPSEKLETPKDKRVSFLAVGDNLIHNSVYWDPYKKEGDSWNYESMYESIKPYLAGIDVKNINQETPLGGRALGLSNYPQFNGPTEIGDAVVHAGFNWVSQASNHAMDAGEQGILNQMGIWDQYEGVISTGMNRTQEERETARIIEKQGLRIGLLNYTYGLNGLSMPDGKAYMVNLIDEAVIRSDIAKLKPHCDVMIASMHWGVEYSYEETEEQKALAQLLSDEGVSVIIGAHPHVIEPATFITSASGQKTLVYYSLGNFISAQDRGDAMLGGMAKWELVKDGKTGEIRVEHAQFYPTVTHFNSAMEDFRAYALKDYTDELARNHFLSSEISRQYFIDLTNQILAQSNGIEVIY